MADKSVLDRIGSLVLILGPVTTLAVSPFSSFDPINLVKLMIVYSFSFSILLLFLRSKSTMLPRLPKSVTYWSFFFIMWMTIVFLISGSPWNQQLWGVFGRNTGFLTYFSLVIILLGVASVGQRFFYHKLVWSLVLVAIPTSVYALIQMAELDPVSWSVMAPFATLGNINFSSAFFGLASLCATVMMFDKKLAMWIRLGLMISVATNLLIILRTGSIQGFMIFLAGMGVVGYLFLRVNEKLKILRVPYLIFGFAGFILTALALKNIGPLARFIFGDTILFRFDYWFAGWAMTMRNPLFGVGLDGYGDWYRQLRGEIATRRTVPDRITNTAHNIYLDISASGGFPLLVAYVAVLFLAGRAAFRVFKRENFFNPYFAAIFSAWVAYLIQAAISINQIGVGIWGWVFTGALIGYERLETSDSTKSIERKFKRRIHSDSNQLSASSALLAILGFGIGFFFAFVPFNADSNFKDSLQSNDPVRQFESAKALGATAYHMELALDAAIKASNETLAAEITDELIERYPRDFMAWRVKQVLSTSTPDQRQKAFETLKAMDPFNPDIEPNQ